MRSLKFFLLSLLAAVPLCGYQARAGPTALTTRNSTSIQEYRVTGVILALQGSTLVLRLRDGRKVMIDISVAQAERQSGALPINRPVVILGVRGPDGRFHATSIGHISPNQKAWPPDTFSGRL